MVGGYGAVWAWAWDGSYYKCTNIAKYGRFINEKIWGIITNTIVVLVFYSYNFVIYISLSYFICYGDFKIIQKKM